MMLGSFEKQPIEIETYSINYSEDLTVGDTVTDCTVTASPEGIQAGYYIAEGQRVRITVSGGLSPVKYKITVTVNTADGRRLQDEFYMKVKEI